MPEFVDLHLHSSYSDGVLTPQQLVAEAAALGLRAIAVADHDNIDAIPEALEAGEQAGIEVIPAVELSVVWQGYRDLHLLGYAFNHRDQRLQEVLATFRAFRLRRTARILDNINRQLASEGRSPLDFVKIQQFAAGTIGRPHIGQALIAAGYASGMEDAFRRYLIPGNEPKRFFPIEDAIQLVHRAGGCTVLAHPPFIGVDETTLDTLLQTFITMGLDGLEAYNTGAGNDGIDRSITLARQRGLIVTGGSDFHQPVAGGIRMGVGRGNLKIPYRCVEEIRMAAERYR